MVGMEKRGKRDYNKKITRKEIPAFVFQNMREEGILIMNTKQTSCDTCVYYLYDEEYDCYVCDRSLDEDEYVRLMTDSRYACPYYRLQDEYAVVRKQM